jgi:Permuted papain-like amidase enzyme, YaeF/YiiX, C92 family
VNAAFPALPLVDYADVRGKIRSGDILLASGSYAFSKLIQHATGSCWSHVAFVMRLDEIDRVMLLESIEGKGVRTVALSEYVRNFEGTGAGYNGRLAIARHSGFEAQATPEKFKAMAQYAVDRFAYPYDDEEITRITLRIVGAALGLPKQERVENEQYICSEYVDISCFRPLGIHVPFDARGFIAPADYAACSDIELLWELKTTQTIGETQP